MATPGEHASSSANRDPDWLISLNRVNEFVTANVAKIGAVIIIAVLCLVCADILSSKLLSIGIRGTQDWVGYVVVIGAYLQMPNAIRLGRFIFAEMIIDPLMERRPAAAHTFRAIYCLIGVFVFMMVADGAYRMFDRAYPNANLSTIGSYLPEWPLRLIVAVGAILCAVGFALRCVEHVVHALRGRFDLHVLKWLALVPVFILLLVLVGSADLSKPVLGGLSLFFMVAIVVMGVPIGPGLLLIGFIFMLFISPKPWTLFFTDFWEFLDGRPSRAFRYVQNTTNEFSRNYDFGVLPLFVLMGMLINESGLGKDTFDVARWLTRRIKGGLGVATVVANAIFAAVTGSSMASATVFTKVATPQMLEFGYGPRFAVGVVAGSSMLGMLIPPSMLLIIYSYIAEVSILQLFTAAITPGILLATLMCIAIVLMSYFWKSYVGEPHVAQADDEDISSALKKVTPIVLLIMLVLGGLYGGWFGPVEAGAVGAAGALIIAMFRGGFTLTKFWKAALETGTVTSSLLFMILGAVVYSQMIVLSGLPEFLSELLQNFGFSLIAIMLAFLVLLIIAGMFLESLSILLITVPIMLPIVESFGGSAVWLGIVTLIGLEMGLLTPPLGIACFVVKSALNDDRVSLQDIFIGALPFVFIMLITVLLLIFFPQIALWLV